MERCPGVALRDVVDTMSPAELDHIAEHPKTFRTRMETITSPMNTMGSVTEKPFTTLEEFVAYNRWMIILGCTEAWTESVLFQLPKEATVQFAYAALVPKNIIDWGMSGFFPDIWEYGRIHDPVETTRG
ncbi:hypothetical protein F5146DRAFT_1227067 [Armillaria mellea]|nr:hypothetical protein F5146DRAFT_1227067 [Armillaria mellea]